jgi:hypothetical protein
MMQRSSRAATDKKTFCEDLCLFASSCTEFDTLESESLSISAYNCRIIGSIKDWNEELMKVISY